MTDYHPSTFPVSVCKRSMVERCNNDCVFAYRCTDNAVYALDETTYEVPNHVKVSGPVDKLEEFPVLPLASVDRSEYAEAADAYLVPVSGV